MYVNMWRMLQGQCGSDSQTTHNTKTIFIIHITHSGSDFGGGCPGARTPLDPTVNPALAALAQSLDTERHRLTINVTAR